MIPSSLVVTYKYNEEPPIISLIQRYKHHYDKSNLISQSRMVVRLHFSIVRHSDSFYAKYGIALEAHLQNSISTFNADGRLNTIYIRDFEGLRIDVNNFK